MATTAGWILSIDFGTSNTAAAFSLDGRVRAVPLDSASTTMPSAVVLTDNGFRVGRAAENARRSRPEAFEGAPKSLLGRPLVRLGDRELTPPELVAQVLTVVRERAVARAGGTPPERVVLTLPAQWGDTKRAALLQAAAIAGFPDDRTVLLPEPVAALHAYVTAADLSAGDRVAVVDFGGGTCDVAVLEGTTDSTPGRELVVVATDGDERLGGNDLDDRLLSWVTSQLRAGGDQALVRKLGQPEHLGALLTLRTVVRSAKQDLSEHPDAEIAVSVAGDERVLRVTRDEYEQLIAPEMRRLGELARRALDASGTTRLAGLYLTGGSAQTPAVARVLHKVTGVLATPLGDPKLAVAEGALRVPVVTGAARTSVPDVRQAGPARTEPARVPPPAEPAGVPDRDRQADGHRPTYPRTGPPPNADAGHARHEHAVPAPPPGLPGPPVPQGRTWSPPHAPDRLPGPVPPPPPGGPGPAGTGPVGPSGSTAVEVRRPRRWYARPAGLAAIAAAVLVLLLVAGQSSDGTATGSANSGTTYECPDGAVVGTRAEYLECLGTEDESETDGQQDEIACWDGSVTTGACPAVRGEEAMLWAFDPSFETPAECAAILAYAPGAPEAQLECTWADATSVVRLMEYRSPQDARAAWADFGGELSAWQVVGDPGEAGLRVTGSFPVDGTPWLFETRCYDALPFCFMVYAGDAASLDEGVGRVYGQDAATVQGALDAARPR